MWGSFDELYYDAFEKVDRGDNFMAESDIKVMYFRLISRYRTLEYDYNVSKDKYKKLFSEFTVLSKKYHAIVGTRDIVSGYLYRSLKSKYDELSTDYSRVLDANIKLSNELLSFKSKSSELDDQDADIISY